MRHAVAIFTIVALAAAAPAQGKDRAPRFADYPVANLSCLRVAKPKVPKGWGDDPRLRLQDTVGHLDSRTNFAGRYFLAVVGCGSTCIWGAIVEPKSGRMIALQSASSWFETHDKFEAIDFRHNSRLIAMSGARNEKKGDMGRHLCVRERETEAFEDDQAGGELYQRESVGSPVRTTPRCI
ncbi:MAG: hypothetical protein K2Y27_01960 [Xanthobacteraceae bacterium]|nr:hypothetical protein [Xanthobacteraceae bacterium]